MGPASQAPAAQGDVTLSVQPPAIQKFWAPNMHVCASLLPPSASWGQRPAALLRDGQTSNVRQNEKKVNIEQGWAKKTSVECTHCNVNATLLSFPWRNKIEDNFGLRQGFKNAQKFGSVDYFHLVG